jgi:4-oxalocrotonate tautomerase
MPLIEVTMMEGRTVEQKRKMVADVTTAVETALGAQRQTIRVAIREIPAEHWAVGGETIAARQERETSAGGD